MLQDVSDGYFVWEETATPHFEAVNPLPSLAALTANVEHAVREAFVREDCLGNACCFASNSKDLAHQLVHHLLSSRLCTYIIESRTIASLKEAI